jgi:hypothetical protein
MQLMSVVLPILINCLKEAEGSRVSKQAQVLHEQSIGWLMRTAPRYPLEFKLLMNQLPQFRAMIHNAIKGSHIATQAAATASSTANVTTATKNPSQQQPAIKLKTDFSNFM